MPVKPRVSPATQGAQTDGAVSLVVTRIVHVDAHVLVLDGRCATGVIAPGTRFTLAVETQVLERDGALSTRDGDARAVGLVVDALEAYGRLWKALEAGMTVRATLSGHGADCVREGDVLRSAVG